MQYLEAPVANSSSVPSFRPQLEFKRKRRIALPFAVHVVPVAYFLVWTYGSSAGQPGSIGPCPR